MHSIYCHILAVRRLVLVSVVENNREHYITFRICSTSSLVKGASVGVWKFCSFKMPITAKPLKEIISRVHDRTAKAPLDTFRRLDETYNLNKTGNRADLNGFTRCLKPKHQTQLCLHSYTDVPWQAAKASLAQLRWPCAIYQPANHLRTDCPQFNCT